ncbi:MAG: hypothetical protein WA999_07245 [Spirulinaceae cyanobacterium]
MAIPRLNLAPKLKRPLSLWNPWDYLRLLYWVFYFPQALRWYEETFAGGVRLGDKKTSEEKWQLLKENPVRFSFWLQGLLLSAFAPLLLNLLLRTFGIAIPIGVVVIPVVISWILGLMLCILEDWGDFGDDIGETVAESVAASVVAGVIGSLALCLMGLEDLPFVLAGGLMFGLILGFFGSVVGSAKKKIPFYLASSVTGLLTIALLDLFLLVVMFLGYTEKPLEGIMFFTAIYGTAIFCCTRLDVWLVTTLFMPWWIWPARATSIPLITLSHRIKIWLKQDWETALHNIDQLLRYTLQWIPVVNALKQFLAVTPDEQLIWRITQLVKSPYDWQLIGFIATSSGAVLKVNITEALTLRDRHQKPELQKTFPENIRLDKPYCAVTAGFWYLHDLQPAKALEAFTKVRSLAYGEELFILAQTLTNLQQAKTTKEIAATNLPTFPSKALLRPNTWDFITQLHQVIEKVQALQNETSSAAKSSILNRVQRDLDDILDHRDSIPEAEQELIIDIAATWRNALII